jgi:hypothetical protein
MAREQQSRCFVLLHSPLLGPASWEWVATVLRQRNELVVVPSFAGFDSATEPFWQWCTGLAVEAIEGLPVDMPVVLVGHSASGLLLPPVSTGCAAAGHTVVASVFADAQIPDDVPADGDWFLDHARSISRAGRLPPWSEWWGEGAMDALVPDPERRARIVAELQSVPLTYLEEAPPPGNGPLGRPTNLRFSSVYIATADVARGRGWPVVEVPGEHLHMTVDPEAVAAQLISIANDAIGSTWRYVT